MRLKLGHFHALAILCAIGTGAPARAEDPVTCDVNQESTTGATSGPDMTFCELYDLHHYGTLGDVLGLAVATTCWNIGDVPVPWHHAPDPNHPFIIMNLYRLRTVDGARRFEQIGQSWARHGFCALSNNRCGGWCAFTPCSTLGVNCTHTRTSSLNSARVHTGPRYEIDPWLRKWSFVGSHLEKGLHDHDPIEHRLQVHEADLNPDLNPGAEYFVESFFLCPADINQLNSVAWKPVVPRYDAFSELWMIEMTDSRVHPEIGFAIGAWSEAHHTVVAQRTPVLETTSPDGRCILAAEATSIGAGLWHYEYALLNVDMDRQVGSFRIPIAPGTLVSNVGFHLVEHHDEAVNTVDPDAVPIDNAPWAWGVASDAVIWSTETNPLRWGTLYTFRFDADQPPTSATVTLGMFRPGCVELVYGATIGPHSEDCNANGRSDACDVSCSAALCNAPCETSADADGNSRPDECGTFYPGDLDAGGSVDMDDYLIWFACPTPPCPAPPCDPPLYSGTSCAQADLDVDGDVDLADFRRFQCCFGASF